MPRRTALEGVYELSRSSYKTLRKTSAQVCRPGKVTVSYGSVPWLYRTEGSPIYTPTRQSPWGARGEASPAAPRPTPSSTDSQVHLGRSCSSPLAALLAEPPMLGSGPHRAPPGTRSCHNWAERDHEALAHTHSEKNTPNWNQNPQTNKASRDLSASGAANRPPGHKPTRSLARNPALMRSHQWSLSLLTFHLQRTAQGTHSNSFSCSSLLPPSLG